MMGVYKIWILNMKPLKLNNIMNKIKSWTVSNSHVSIKHFEYETVQAKFHYFENNE
jgi:hypothetical protein